MNFKNYKYEIIFGSIFLSLFATLFLNIFNWSPKKAGFLNNVSFEMIRPKSDFRSEYSLKDREIDREFVNPFQKKGSNAKNDKHQNAKLVPITKASESKKTAAKAQTPAKKTGMQVNVVPKSDDGGLSGEDFDLNSGYNRTNKANNQINNSHPQDKATQEDNNNKKKTDYSDLASNPTQEKVKEFIMAYKQGDITADEFYSVIEKMLTSGNPNSQSMAVYACYTFPSVTSFSLVAENIDSLSAEVKNYANEFLQSYNHQARLQFLGQALQSKNLKVVMKAGEVIMTGLQKVKSGNYISYSGREARGNNNITSIKFFDFLVPIAESMKKSGDQSVVALGQSISQELN